MHLMAGMGQSCQVWTLASPCSVRTWRQHLGLDLCSFCFVCVGVYMALNGMISVRHDCHCLIVHLPAPCMWIMLLGSPLVPIAINHQVASGLGFKGRSVTRVG